MKRIEAQAVISAKDATGRVFAAIAAKIAKLSATAKSASSRAAAAEGRAGAMERAGMKQQRGLGSRLAGAGTSLSYVGANVAGIPGIGVAGGAYLGIKSYKTYAEAELALKRIGITAEASDEQVAALDKTVRTVALQTGKSFQEVTGGLESIVAAGFDLDKAVKALPAVARTAQASGAEVKDMATSMITMNQAMGIPVEKMQSSFDALVTAGKEGKFELKDMARYLPSILPAFGALGYKGEEGLKKVAALMQTVRAGTGTTEEAAQSITNIIQKMESEETANKFKKMGVDLRSEMAKARKDGADLLDTFRKLTQKALKGDMSKLPQLFNDQQFNRGMTAWLTFGDVFDKVMGKMNTTFGTAEKDLSKVLESPQMAINRLSESWNRLLTQLGKELDEVGVTKAIERIVAKSQEKIDRAQMTPEQRDHADRVDAAKREVASLDAKIAQEEEELKKPDMFLPGGTSRHQGRAERLKALRQRRVEAQTAADQSFGGNNLFSKDEAKALKEAQDERERAQRALDPTSDDFIGPRSWEAKRGIPNPMTRPTGIPGDASKEAAAAGKNTHDIGPVTAQLSGTADVKGEAGVNIKVDVSASPQLIATVEKVDRLAVQLQGSLRAAAGNGPGTTGRSSPDTGAPSTGARGKW